MSAHAGLLLCSETCVANTIAVDTSVLTGTNLGFFSQARLILLHGQQQPLVFVRLVIECLLFSILYSSPGTLSHWDYFLHLADKETEAEDSVIVRGLLA